MTTKTISHNSHVEIFTDNGIKLIRKTFRLGMSRSTAEDIRQQVLLQRQNFANIHVPTSKLVDIDIEPDEGEFRLVITEEFAGLDFMDVVDDDNFAMYIDKVLGEIMRPLLSSTEQDYLSAGIDGTPRNFVFNQKRNEFCYVDFIPPKVFFKGRYTQEIPELTDEHFYEIRLTSHNHRAGVLYNFYINTIRELPAQLQLLTAKLEQFTAELNQPQLFEMIGSSKLYRVHEIDTFAEIVKGIDNWYGENFFLLREAANWLNLLHPGLTELKKQIYQATSQERDPASPDYGRITAANFAKAKQLLLQGADQCRQDHTA